MWKSYDKDGSGDLDIDEARVFIMEVMNLVKTNSYLDETIF